MALTLNNFIGFETGGLDEAQATSGAPAVNSDTPHSGSYYLRVNGSQTYDVPAFEDFSAKSGNNYIFGCWLRVSSLSTGLQILRAQDSSDGNHWQLSFASSTEFRITYADASTEDFTHDLSADTWHLIEILWSRQDGTGIFELFVDGSSKKSATSKDTNTGLALDHYRFLSGTGINVDFDDVYTYSGATDTDDFLGASEVFLYQGAPTTTYTESGDAPDVGSWDNVNEETGGAPEAEYSGTPRDGGFDTDGTSRDGPSGDSRVEGDSNIKGSKAIHRMKRGNGGGTTHWKKFGNTGDGFSTRDISAGLSTAYAYFFELSEAAGVTPTSSEFFKVGMQLSGARDLFMQDAWSTLLHVPTGEQVASVTPLAAAFAVQPATIAVTVPVDANAAAWSAQLATISASIPVQALSAAWSVQAVAISQADAAVVTPVVATWSVQPVAVSAFVRVAPVSATWAVTATTISVSVPVAAIPATWAVQTATVTVIIGVAPAVATWTVQPVIVSAGAVAAVDPVVATWAVVAASVSLSVPVTPVAGAWSVQAPTISPSVPVAAVAATWSVKTITTGVVVPASVNLTTFTVQATMISVVVAVAPVNATWSVQGATISVAIPAQPFAAVWSVQAVTIETGVDQTAVVTPIVSAWSVQAITASVGVLTSPNVATWTVQTVQIPVAGTAIVTPVVATWTVQPVAIRTWTFLKLTRLYQASEWRPNVFLEATLAADTDTARATLFDQTDDRFVHEADISNASTTAARKRSGALPLIDGHEYVGVVGHEPGGQAFADSVDLVAN